MRALRSYGPGDMRVVDVDDPVPGDDKVIVEVDWCGICGSDLHLWHIGPQAMCRLPTGATVIPGHEIAGRVVHAPAGSRSGQSGQALTPGTAVFVDPRLLCFACPQCKPPPAAALLGNTDVSPGDLEPNSQGCVRMPAFLGFSAAPDEGGGFAERVAVDPRMLHVLPAASCERLRPDGDLSAAAALVEPLAVAWHAVRRGGLHPASGRSDSASQNTKLSVLVTGGGPVGVAVCHVLRTCGGRVGKILVSEPVARRRDGLAGVATGLVDPTVEGVAERCRRETEGRGVDVVFECSGNAGVMGDCFASLAFRGTMVVVALWPEEMRIPSLELMHKEITLTSSISYNEADIAAVIDALEKGDLQGCENMVTARISLEDVVEKGFKALAHPDMAHVKILVTPKKR